MALTQWWELTPQEREERTTLQKVYEEDLFNSGVERYWQDWSRANDEGKPEQLLLESSVVHLAPYYQKWIDLASSHRKSPHWLAPLLTLGADKMADLTIRSVIKVFLSRSNLQTFGMTYKGMPYTAPTAQLIAKNIADDAIAIISYQQAKNLYKDDWMRQSKFIKNWTPKRCKAFTTKMLTVPKYTPQQKEDFGHNMLRIALESEILVSRVIFKSKRRKALLVSLAPEILKELKNRHELLETAAMVYRPMICPPVPHSVDEDGGSLSPWVRKKMIKRYHPVGADPKEWNSKPSQSVLDSINGLANTEWSVNDRVLETMSTMFYNDHRNANLPAYTFKDFAFSRPYPEDGDKIDKAKWMQESNEAWGDWYKEEQSRSRMLVRLDLARKMSDYDFFYMPWTLDFRGRAYTACELLSCQGIDFDRALIQFATPVKQTERGMYWLKIHLANLFDQDKLSYDARVQWVDENMDMIQRINSDPLTFTDWIDDSKKKNKSFQRLAAVFEVCREDGMTQLPVQIDGKNNGVQHWSAIRRDPTLAKLTNVLPSDDNQDLYQFIADRSYEHMLDNPNNIDWFDKFVEHWNEGLPRSVPKRSTMCDAYGLTFYGMQKYVKEEGHVDWVDREERGGAIVELSRAIQEGLGSAMQEPNIGKDYLRQVARILNDLNLPLVWTTPSGFVVQHVYNQIIERVSYAELFNRQSLVFASLTDQLDDKAQFLAVSPNFIHSLDAAHMFMVVFRLLNEYCIDAFSFVHDSFGTYGPYIDTMQLVLKEEFVNIHRENPLVQFKKDLEERYDIVLPDVPENNHDFNIEEVLKSLYIFS